MRRPRIALLALPLLVAPLAACGSDEATAVEVVRGAPAATVEAQTARMAFEISMPTGPMGAAGTGTLTGEGVIDFERRIGSMSFDLASMLQATGEQVPPGTDTRMEMVFEGTVYYLRFPMLAGALGPESQGKEWIRIDAGAMAADMGIDLSQIEQLGNDPRQQLAYLTGVSDDIEEVGEDDVRGEKVTRYRGTARMDLMFEQLEAQAVVDVDRLRQQVEQLGIEEIPFDVWIDDEGRARRMEMTMPTPPEAGAGDVRVAIEMFDFGTAVDVQPPSPEITLDANEMMAGAGG